MHERYQHYLWLIFIESVEFSETQDSAFNAFSNMFL